MSTFVVYTAYNYCNLIWYEIFYFDIEAMNVNVMHPKQKFSSSSIYQKWMDGQDATALLRYISRYRYSHDVI